MEASDDDAGLLFQESATFANDNFILENHNQI